MTTPTFVINGSITCYGVQAAWTRQPKRQNSNGVTTYQPYASHVWDIAQMEMSTFLLLQAQQGKQLTSIATTNVNDINNGATYTVAEMGLITAQQTGRRATGVRVEFRIDTS